MIEKISDAPVKAIEDNKRKFKELLKGSGKVIVKADWPGTAGANQVTCYEDENKYFDCLIDGYNKKCLAARYDFDSIPCVSIDFGGISWLMSLAYGCRMLKLNGLINSEPLFHDISEACSFERREKIYNYGLYPKITETTIRFQELYPDIPIGLPDNQSPSDILTTIIHTEAALYAMYDEPEEIHRIMGIITDSVIELAKYYKGIIKNFAGFRSGVYQPVGMHVFDDNAAFLSPGFYIDFAKPYAEKLSEEFGGINFHCCRGYAQNFESMASVKGFIGYDGNPDFNPMDRIIDGMRHGGKVWQMSFYPWSRNEVRSVPDEEIFMKAIDATEGVCGLDITLYGSSMEDALRRAEIVKNYAAGKGRLA